MAVEVYDRDGENWARDEFGFSRKLTFTENALYKLTGKVPSQLAAEVFPEQPPSE